MREFVAELAEESGRAPGEVEGALGILMAYLLDTVRADTADKLRAALPGLAGLAEPHRSRGFFGAVLGGTGALMALPGKLSKLGFDRPAAKKVGPRILTWLRGRVDPALWDEVEGQLPAMLRKKK